MFDIALAHCSSHSAVDVVANKVQKCTLLRVHLPSTLLSAKYSYNPMTYTALPTVSGQVY